MSQNKSQSQDFCCTMTKKMCSQCPVINERARRRLQQADCCLCVCTVDGVGADTVSYPEHSHRHTACVRIRATWAISCKLSRTFSISQNVQARRGGIPLQLQHSGRKGRSCWRPACAIQKEGSTGWRPACATQEGGALLLEASLCYSEGSTCWGPACATQEGGEDLLEASLCYLVINLSAEDRSFVFKSDNGYHILMKQHWHTQSSANSSRLLTTYLI